MGAVVGRTPAGQGFRMAAEWEPHEATWLGWPHNASDWPGKIAPIHWVYGEIVRKIAPAETVHILVESAAHEAQARRVLVKANAHLDTVRFHRVPTNRGWTRDMGPAFVVRDRPKREVAIVRFRFNGWAKYPDYRKDDRVPERAGRITKKRLLPAHFFGRDVVLEGGSIDSNGAGVLLTTEECLLDPEVQVRNPGFGRAEWEHVFAETLGVTQTVWLGKGIAGDDTHGHVDDLCRFVGPRTVVLCTESSGTDANHRALAENAERLASVRLAGGERLEVVPLPMPGPVVFAGRRLPASYANFYIGNAAVLVPTFNDPNDRVALGLLADLIRDRPVVGIHAVDLVWGLGTLHCLTREQPRG